MGQGAGALRPADMPGGEAAGGWANFNRGDQRAASAVAGLTILQGLRRQGWRRPAHPLVPAMDGWRPGGAGCGGGAGFTEVNANQAHCDTEAGKCA